MTLEELGCRGTLKKARRVPEIIAVLYAVLSVLKISDQNAFSFGQDQNMPIVLSFWRHPMVKGSIVRVDKSGERGQHCLVPW